MKNDIKSSVYEQLESICKEMQECDKRIKVLLNASRELTHRNNLVNDERAIKIHEKYNIGI